MDGSDWGRYFPPNELGRNWHDAFMQSVHGGLMPAELGCLKVLFFRWLLMFPKALARTARRVKI